MKAWSRESKVQKGRESSFSRPRQRLAPAEKQLRSVKRTKRDRLVRRCAPRRCSGASSGSHTLRTVLPVLLAPGAGCPVDDRRAQNPLPLLSSTSPACRNSPGGRVTRSCSCSVSNVGTDRTSRTAGPLPSVLLQSPVLPQTFV